MEAGGRLGEQSGDQTGEDVKSPRYGSVMFMKGPVSARSRLRAEFGRRSMTDFASGATESKRAAARLAMAAGYKLAVTSNERAVFALAAAATALRRAASRANGRLELVLAEQQDPCIDVGGRSIDDRNARFFRWVADRSARALPATQQPNQSKNTKATHGVAAGSLAITR